MSLNKSEAAKFLGVSERAIERYAKRFNLSVSYVREETSDGRTRSVAHYDQKELKQVQQQIEASKETGSPLPNAQPEGQGLMRREPSPDAPVVGVSGLLAALLQLPVKKQVVPLADKPTLSVDEASALTGFSPDSLRAAIHSKKLHGKKIPGRRGFTIKRVDLEIWIKKL